MTQTARPLTVVLSQAGFGEDSPSLAIPSTPVVVGRGGSSDLRLAHPSLSLEHAALWERLGEIWIADLGSVEGSWVEGRRIHQATRIHPGRPLRLGRVGFELHRPGGRPAYLATGAGYPYVVRAALHDGVEAEASIAHVARPRKPVILTGYQGMLTYLLARSWVEEHDAGMSSARHGWLSTDRVSVDLWGRNYRPDRLSVLVFRVRRKLEEMGMNGGCVERRRGRVRLNVLSCELEG